MNVLRAVLACVAAGEPVALATIVATRGSTPRKVSTRLAVSPGGRAVGTLGGGAVEADAIREAAVVLASGGPVLREYSMATATDEWGLACGGTMVVFIERLDPGSAAWVRRVAEAVGAGGAVSVVGPVEGAGAGTRLVVDKRETAGSLGDAALDAEATALGRRVLEREGAELASLGGMRSYAEAFLPVPSLVVLGAGHVGKALATLGKFLGMRVTVVDDREEYATGARFPEADRVVAAPVEDAVRGLAVSPRTAIVVAMRNHDLDYEAVRAAVRTEAAYVGLVGARRKAILIAERLIADGVPPERVRSVRSPIGLDIGARTPEEIALAILGEWIMLRQGGSGGPLRLADELFAKATTRGGGGAAPRGNPPAEGP